MRLLPILLAASLLAAACGTKGPLTLPSQVTANRPAFTAIGESAGLLATPADREACRKVCEPACPKPASGDKPAMPASASWPWQGAVPAAAKEPATCVGICVSQCPAGFARTAAKPDDNKGGSSAPAPVGQVSSPSNSQK